MSTTDSRSKHNNNKIEKIIAVDTTQVEFQVRQKLKEKLSQDAQYLLYKKKREEEKKQRVKKMEDQIERKRLQKLKLISEREAKTQMVRQKQKQELDRKVKQKSEHYKKVADKIQHNYEQQIQKSLHMQKQLEGKKNKMFSKTSKDNLHKINSARSQLAKDYGDIEQQIIKLTDKSNKAQRLHQLQNKLMVEKIKQKTKSIQQAKQRAANNSMIIQSQKCRSVYEKINEIEKISQKTKTQSEKRLVQKRKSVKQKLDKCNQNLRHLSVLQQQKYQQLQDKFNRKSEPKQWKDVRLQKYKQKWEQNTKRLSLQKSARAQQILQKHQQISQQHKMYKQQKDKLIQAVKCSN